ncbi:hypothetical protein [Flavobacterium sp.]|uniref:hypothetical protein n=1 Tax=Flavobacterium sp. TaxID=239 RepID=UPI002FDEDCB8
MKKLILLSSILLLSSFNSVESDVYICGAKGAKKYHFSKTCRGFSSCKHEIKKVTLKEAESYGLTLCGWEN